MLTRGMASVLARRQAEALFPLPERILQLGSYLQLERIPDVPLATLLICDKNDNVFEFSVCTLARPLQTGRSLWYGQTNFEGVGRNGWKPVDRHAADT